MTFQTVLSTKKQSGDHTFTIIFLVRDPTAKMLAKPEFLRMIKELLQSMSPGQLLPKAFEKCGLFPVNKEKVPESIPSIKTLQNVAEHHRRQQ
jgi:hypothetical protein